jgi:hypothetical protein
MHRCFRDGEHDATALGYKRDLNLLHGRWFGRMSDSLQSNPQIGGNRLCLTGLSPAPRLTPSYGTLSWPVLRTSFLSCPACVR